MDDKEKEQYEEDSDADDIDPELIELMKKEIAKMEAERASSSDTEMVTLRIGGKWQSISKECLNQTRQAMKTLTPMERKVMQMYFGLPEEYFDECD